MFLLGSLPPALAAGASGTQVKTVVIPVEGMVCVACAATVKGALKSIAGVSHVEVNLEKRTAQVTYAPDKLSPDRLVEAINKRGYRAGVPKEVE
jgi:copper chaperone CopZ